MKPARFLFVLLILALSVMSSALAVGAGNRFSGSAGRADVEAWVGGLPLDGR